MNKVIYLIGKDKFDKIDFSKNYGANSIIITAVDSIFSIQAQYISTVVPLVKRFASFVGLKDLNNDQYTPKQFIETFKNYDFNSLATLVFKNKQRTSSQNGILKAEALYRIVEMLNNNNIQTRNDILNSKNIDDIEDQWKSVKGQGSGITWRYFLMGCGNNTYFKDDTWVYRFFINELGYKNIRMGGDYKNLKIAFDNEFEQVKKVYPQMTVTKLDNVIWEFMSTRK